MNDTWVYLNDSFQKSEREKGFLGLDLVRVVGFDGDAPVFDREPLEEHVHGCFADIESINGQGFYTKKAKTPKFEQGKTVYANKPLEGAVVGLVAYSYRSGLGAFGNPEVANPRLGGFVRAVGTSQKTEGEK